ncbi:MAG: F0F1 ATP synthase subunit B [Phycisphaera sp.]|nr:MAG: F0F1 ATP synthase subunit B [Phycisphaera sp.]
MRRSLIQSSSGMVASAAVLLLPAIAMAADEAGKKGTVIPGIKQGVPMMIAALLVFGIVFFILWKFAWPPVAKGLEERDRKILEGLEASKRALAEADAMKERYESQLTEARGEAQRILADTKARQAEFTAELRSKADAEIARMRERAQRDIDAARRVAVNELYAESARLATLMASKILEREVSEQDQTRLVEQALSEFESGRKASNN